MDSTTTGGYYINCIAIKDAAEPYCDNGGNGWCLQKTDCNNRKKKTICIGGVWASSTCGECKTGYHDCNGDDDCIDYNEHDGNPCPGGYYQSCSCVKSVLKLGPDSLSANNTIIQSASNTLMYINGDGMSVGTSSLVTGIKLYIYDAASGPIISLSGLDSNYRGLAIKDTGDAEKWFIGNNTSTNFVLRQNGSTDLLTVLSSGNVGVGTTTPSAKLDVNGTLAVRGAVSFTNSLYTSTSSRLLMVDADGNVSATTTLAGISMPAGTPGQTMRYGTSAWEATSAIYVKDDGNVGIGDTGPTNKLSVIGDIAGSETLKIGNSAGLSYILGNLSVGGVTGFTNITLNRYLDIVGDDYAGAVLRTTDVSSIMISAQNGTPAGANFGYAGKQMVVGTINNSPINFIASGTSKMLMTSSGKVGIGTTNPQTSLDVIGGSRFYASGGGRYFWISPSSDNQEIGTSGGQLNLVPASGSILIYREGLDTTLTMHDSNGSDTVRLNSHGSSFFVGGNVGIGTQEPVAKLQIDPFWFSNPDETDTINLAESDFANVSVAPQAMITMNNRDRSPGAAIGLALHNADRHPGAYAPLLVFSKSEISGQGKGFNSAIAAIGAQTVEGTGGHGMWVDGDLMFYTAPKNGGGLVERMRITQGGNVGINTQNPLAKLDVNGSLAVRGAVAFTNSLYTGTSSRLLMVDASGNVSATTTLAGISMPAGTTGQTMRYGTSAWEATSAIYVKNDGNVGIGDIGPTNKLSVIGNIAGSGTLNISSSGLSYILGNLTMGETGGFTNITLSRYLNISGNDYAGAVLRSADVNSIMISAQNGTPAGANFGYAGKQMVVGTINDSPINFIASGTSKMLMTSSGKVGIGTTAPATTLHIYPNASTEGLRIVSSDYSPLVVRNSTDLVDLFRVNQSGDVTAVTSSATRMRSDNYCDADGNNCFDPSSVGSSIGYFATVTSGTYTGNNNGHPGYDYAHGRCNAQLAGSHVCTAEEILNTIRDNKTLPSVNVWIFNGPPGYTAAANDCEARSTNSESDKYGAYWEAPTTDRPKGRGLLVHCDASLNLACCD